MEKTMRNIVNVLQEINLNTRNIRQTNSKLSVGMSTQARLAREMGQKMNGVGMFLTKITNLKQEEWKNNMVHGKMSTISFFIKVAYFNVNILL